MTRLEKFRELNPDHGDLLDNEVISELCAEDYDLTTDCPDGQDVWEVGSPMSVDCVCYRCWNKEAD